MVSEGARPWRPWGRGRSGDFDSQEIQEKCRESPGRIPGQSRDNPVKFMFMCFLAYCFFFFSGPNLSTSDFQSEVGEVFGEIGGELPAKFGRRFSRFFCWGKSSKAFSTKTPPQISPSNFTTMFWVVAGPTNYPVKETYCVILLFI